METILVSNLTVGLFQKYLLSCICFFTNADQATVRTASSAAFIVLDIANYAVPAQYLNATSNLQRNRRCLIPDLEQHDVIIPAGEDFPFVLAVKECLGVDNLSAHFRAIIPNSGDIITSPPLSVNRAASNAGVELTARGWPRKWDGKVPRTSPASLTLSNMHANGVLRFL